MPATSKTQKRLLYISIALIALIFIFYLFLNYWANNRLPAILGDKVKSKNVDVSVIGNRIKFDEPSVVLDTTNNGSELMLEASAKSILIDGFKIWDLLFEKTIDVEDFIIEGLMVRMEQPGEKPSGSQQEELNLFVKDVFNQIKVSHFEIKDSGLLVRHPEDKDTLYQVEAFHLSADGITLDTATENNPLPLDFDKSKFHADRVYLKLKKKYTLTAKTLRIKDTNFSVKDLRLSPVYSKEEWVERHPYEKARIDLFADTVEMKQLLWNLKGESPLKISSSLAEFGNLRIKVFKDKNPPQEPIHVKPLLTTLIQELPVVITIDTVLFKDTYIEYEQRPVQYPRSGLIVFEKLFMTGYNLTNDTLRIQTDPVTTLDVECRFMDEGELHTTIKLFMDSRDGEFAVSGRLGSMPVTYVNQVLVPLAGAEAEGQVHEIIFDFEGNNFKSQGELQFHYEDLKVTIVDDEREKKWLMSMFGNVAIRNNNTTEQDGSYQKGEIYFARYQNKDFWNYLWNSVRTGLMDVVVPFYDHSDDKDLKRSDAPKYKEGE